MSVWWGGTNWGWAGVCYFSLFYSRDISVLQTRLLAWAAYSLLASFRVKDGSLLAIEYEGSTPHFQHVPFTCTTHVSLTNLCGSLAYPYME